MNVLEIIRSENRTREELEYSFNVLMYSDSSMTKYLTMDMVKNWNFILDNLYLVSKSRIHALDWCKFKFKIQYILYIKDQISKQIMTDGFNLHLADELFWTQGVKVKHLLQTNNIYKTLYNIYLKFIPEFERERPFIQWMIHEFIQFETNRITALFEEIGQTKECIQNYAIPLFHELAIENWDLYLMGIVDRIDRATNEKLIFIDYKYGKPKIYENPTSKTYINTELGFYGLLPQGKRVYAVQNDNGEDYLLPLPEVMQTKETTPYYGSMLFMQNVEETGFIFPINSRILTNANKKINRYWDRLNKGLYPCSPNSSCYEWCKHYWGICQYNPQWMDIQKSVILSEI